MEGAVWLNLVDPAQRLLGEPPWSVRPGLNRTALLDQGMDPKEWVEPWLGELRAAKPTNDPTDFIDLDREEYLTDPHLHLSRLWKHFRE